MTKWLERLLVRDGPNCHLCGFPVFTHKLTKATRLSASQDHIIPNPFLKNSKKRVNKGPEDPANIKLAHRYCNSMRGQRDITDELKAEIKAALVKKMAKHGGMMPQLEEGLAQYEKWRERYLAFERHETDRLIKVVDWRRSHNRDTARIEKTIEERNEYLDRLHRQTDPENFKPWEQREEQER